MKKTLEPYQLIERSIIKKYRKELWPPFIVAVKRYELVQAGDRIAVCISGGKCKAHIRWNKDVGANLTRAMVTGRGKLMQRIIRDTHPLVPFDTGMLDNSAQLATDYETGEIIWSTPYARPQYYLHPQGEGLHGDTGLRGSYWAERSKDANKVSWNQFWKAVMKEETR